MSGPQARLAKSQIAARLHTGVRGQVSCAHLLLDLDLAFPPLVLLSDLCFLGLQQLQLFNVEVLDIRER